MKKLLKINEVAQITGLSVNGIRYYEREGVVHPIYRGKYRYYSLIACAELQRAVNYRDMGFSLPDTVRLVHCTSVDELEDAMLQQRQSVEREISEKRRTLDAIENRIRQLNEVKLQYGHCSLVEGPAYYMIPEFPWHNGGFAVPADFAGGRHFYSRCGPAAAPAILIPLEQLITPSNQFTAYTGTGIPASALSDTLRDEFKQDPSIRYFPPQRCIYTVLFIGGKQLPDLFSHVLDYAAQRGLVFSGDAYTYRIAAIRTAPDSGTGFYAQAWFPVKEK